MEKVSTTIIGAGVVGLAIAYELSAGSRDIIVVEKNKSFGEETSSRNSEVIHAGIYYRPGSLKARLCVAGRKKLYALCGRFSIPHKKLGKLLIANDEQEAKKIESLFQNGLASGVPELRYIGLSELRALEPDVRADAAVFSSESGIIDTHRLMEFLHLGAQERGANFIFSTEVTGIALANGMYRITVREPNGDTFSFSSERVINAAGLNSDAVAGMAGIDIEKNKYRLHYSKGQYFRIRHSERFRVSHLVYPPPTKTSLGIHITPDLGKGLRLGPDERYVPSVSYTVDENDREKFYRSVKKFLPPLECDDIMPDTAGVRPKLQREGEDFRDFVITEESANGLPNFINLVGIESPGLTSCLAIAEMVRGLLR